MGENRSRQDLENIAFGENATPAERSAALHELAELAATPIPEPPGPPAPPEPVAADDVPEPEPGPEAVLHPARRRRTTGAALLAAAVVVGLVIGSAVTYQLTTRGSAASLATSSREPTSAATGHFGQVLAGPDPIARANALLAAKPIPADVYPTTFDLDQTLVPSSTRLVATAGPDVRIFIARQAGAAGGFCLLSATVQTTGPNASGSTTCADPTEFAGQGLTLEEDTFTVVWVGGSIDVNVTAATR